MTSMRYLPWRTALASWCTAGSSPPVIRRRFVPTRLSAKLISVRERRMAENAISLLELHDVETSYGLSRVLFGISLTIARGEMVSLLGRNGMGKTTTVRSIMGLTAPASGSIRFDG